jgi:hypothetical protein
MDISTRENPTRRGGRRVFDWRHHIPRHAPKTGCLGGTEAPVLSAQSIRAWMVPQEAKTPAARREHELGSLDCIREGADAMPARGIGGEIAGVFQERIGSEMVPTPQQISPPGRLGKPNTAPSGPAPANIAPGYLANVARHVGRNNHLSRLPGRASVEAAPWPPEVQWQYAVTSAAFNVIGANIAQHRRLHAVQEDQSTV